MMNGLVCVQPSVARNLSALGLAAFTMLALSTLSGCDSDLQQQLDGKKTERYKKASDGLAEIESNRTTALNEALPKADAKPEGRKHPLMVWRSEFDSGKAAEGDGETAKPGRDDKGKLEKLADEYKGTPTENPARMGVGFVSAAKDWWGGKGNLERYNMFLSGYLSSAAEDAKAQEGNAEYVGWPFQAEAAFDQLFIHANRYYQASNLSLDKQLTSALSYWQLAFGIPALNRERFSDYVTRACRAKAFKDACAGVPHELRPLAIQKPYLEWNIKKAKAYVDTKPAEVFTEVMNRYIGSLTRNLEAMNKTPLDREDPNAPKTWKLPSTTSARGVSSGLNLTISRESGARLHTDVLSESWRSGVPKGLKKQAETTIQTLKDTPGNVIDFERIVLELPPVASSSALTGIVGSFPRDTVRQFDLVGRRRADDSLKRAGILLRLPAEDESDTTSYQFNEMKKKNSCSYLGVAGKPAIGRKSPGSYLVVDQRKGIKTARLTREPETRELIVGETKSIGTAMELDKLGAWASENEGIVRMFIDGDYTYEQIIGMISGVLYKCSDVQTPLDAIGKEVVTVNCGKSEGRDITLVVGICD